MTSAIHHDESGTRRLDRVCELTSIGAGHAAGAMAALTGSPWEMGVPRATVLAGGEHDAPLAALDGMPASACSGVLFEVVGGLGGALALIWRVDAREALLAKLLGDNASIEPQAESALREVGNIAASHAVSAFGELLGTPVLISPPQLELEGAAAAFAALLSSQAEGEETLRVEVELRARSGGHTALLVYAPAPRRA
jgi:chemotaxis protein CheC